MNNKCLSRCPTGLIANGWGQVSEWSAEHIMDGDWSAAVWRSPQLAEAASRIATDDKFLRLCDYNMMPAATGQTLRGRFKQSTRDTPGSFPILKSKGADGQTRIEGIPDEYWIPKELTKQSGIIDELEYPETVRILQKASHLLVTAGQDNSSARLTAVACEDRYVGNSWMPISGLTSIQAMAAAVVINSTFGRLQLMRNPGKKLAFPTYSAKETANLRVPNLIDEDICTILADCWQHTAHMKVPQFRDGECEVRGLWDEAVATAIEWDTDKLVELRLLLHREPHVRGLGYNQYG